MPTPTIIHGFNNLPTPDLTIRENVYHLSEADCGYDESTVFLATTPAEVQAIIDANPGIGWDVNAQYAYYKSDEPYDPETPIQTYISANFSDAATDGTNDYVMCVNVERSCIVPEGYTCEIIPLVRTTADGHFEIMGGRVYTEEQGVKNLAIQDSVNLGYFDAHGEMPTDLTFLVTLNDLDTGDKYAEANGEADTYGNNYHGAEDYIWPYQESWAFPTGLPAWEAYVPDKVYVSNGSWLTTGTIDAFDVPNAATAFGNSHSTDCDGDECSMVYLSTVVEGYTDVMGLFSTSAGSLRLFSSLAKSDSYTIVASADNGGSISDDGSTTVEEGGCMTYTITPDEGYQVGQIIVDGQLVGYNMTEYSFCPVHADHTIHVTFIDDDIAPCSVEAPEIDVPPIDPLTAEEEFVDELPESGEANTVYYVTDGEGYDIYYWDGTKFVKIA